jgi:hypothetical protein
MNERIRKFAEQSGFFPVPDETETDWEYRAENARYENFAELIVQECIQVCKSRVGNSDYTTGRMHCVSDLKEHFGVEE